MECTVSNINSGLYGPTATQLMGGYQPYNNSYSSRFRNGYSMAADGMNGGGHGPIGSVRGMFGGLVNGVLRPEYLQDKDWQKFMNAFMIIKRIATSKPSCVYIVPSSSTLTSMIKDLEQSVKKNGIDTMSEHFEQFLATTPQKYKSYIFSAFGGDSKRYRLDAEYKKPKPRINSIRFI